ncbi:MAG: hypothetical protein EZS28_011381 [Streblomastix strix]|uniref:Uncharacterized protein n=1 Tax=Streblomastix strix TaxID=222440 RepID=A0A5J4WFA4_9EUKA|nr:MAG: hypothetical protein EZS28_011381 [Streblomastix strix]
MNLLFNNKFDKFDYTCKESTFIFVGLKNSAELIKQYVLYHRGKTIDGSLQNDATTESFIYTSIKLKSEKNNNRFVHSLYENVYKDDISCCGRYLSIKENSEVLAPQTSSPYTMPVGFTVSIPLDDLLIFSAFSEHPNSLFGDLKMKFKINPNAFVFCQVDPVLSMAKYYTINKDELLSSGQDKLKDIDLIFLNWSLTFQYTNIYTQIGCTADLVTGIRAEELTPSGLKNLVCNIQPVTVSVRNYIIEAVTANMCRYKASESCLNRVRQFYSNRPYVVPAQRSESWVFPSEDSSAGIKTTQNIPLSHVTDMCLLFPMDARHVTCYENPCYFDKLINQMNRNFPDFPMNTLNEQFFTMQLQANNLDNIFEVCDEYENSLATPRASKTRRYNPVSDYTSFFITIQCERNSNGVLTFDVLYLKNWNTSIELKRHPMFAGEVDTYYNVDTNRNHHLLQFCALCMILSSHLVLQMEDLAYTIQLIHLIRLLTRLLHDIDGYYFCYKMPFDMTSAPNVKRFVILQDDCTNKPSEVAVQLEIDDQDSIIQKNTLVEQF